MQQIIVSITKILLLISLVITPVYAGESAEPQPFDLHDFIGTWDVAEQKAPPFDTVRVKKAGAGYQVTVWGPCAKASHCQWGTIEVSDLYPHGLKPWDPKHEIAFVAFKQFAPGKTGFAMYNVFTQFSGRPDQLIETMLVPHR